MITGKCTIMKNTLLSIPFLFLAFLPLSFYRQTSAPAAKTGTVKITFVNTVKGVPVELNTGSYANPFNEVYTVSKFKYYISHVSLSSTAGAFNENESYHLVDESNPNGLSFSFEANENKYQSISFLLGVDSLKNVSGAQSGALDPLNDMFWTWNSGYIMAKIEGNSPQSKVVNQKVEFHIGGFSGANNVLKHLTTNFPAGKVLNIQEGKTSEIIIEADIDKWWQGAHDIKIAEHPVCTTPGALAKQFADNYSQMFSVKKIINN